jgi:transcriptional regulator with XRE-family HTH domain
MQPRVQFNTQALVEDMAVKGWQKQDLARAAGVADMTVIRFLRAERQTAKTARKLAKALGFSVRRYIVPVAVDDVASVLSPPPPCPEAQ